MKLCSRRITSGKCGQAIAEFVLVLPVALFLVVLVIETALVGMRGIIVQHAAMRATRVAEVYQREFMDSEVNAELPIALFRGGVAMAGDANDVEIKALSRPLFQIDILRPATLLSRTSPKIFALPPGLTEAVLRGGDSPSPYCLSGTGYESCDYPK